MLDATSPRDRRRRLLAVGWGIALAAALVVGPLASVALGADPDPTPTPTPTATPSPTTVAYRLNLLRSGDFIRQYTRYQCVGASLQIMRNMIWSSNNRGPTLQKKLWRIARSNSLYKADGGADAFGWTTATALSGHGRYVLVAAPTMAKAVAAAAKGMAATHRPAGLMVWRGTHAWVMTGFEATGDPNETDAFRVLTIRMADPLWPVYHVAAHRVYRPGMRLYMGTLKKNFTPYHDGRRDDRVEGQFVAIVPIPDGDPLPDYAWAPKVGPQSSPTPSPTPSPSPSFGAATSASSRLTPTSTATPKPTPTAAPTPTPDPSAESTPEPTAGP